MNTQSNNMEEKESDGEISLTTIFIWIGAFLLLFPIFKYLFMIIWYLMRALLATIIGS